MQRTIILQSFSPECRISLRYFVSQGTSGSVVPYLFNDLEIWPAACMPEKYRSKLGWELHVKNLGLSIVAIVALGVGVTTPAYASSGGSGFICKLLPFLCPPAPGGSGPPKSVPEPATMAVLAAGVAASLAARRRRDKNK